MKTGLRSLLVLGVLLGTAYALASWNWCSPQLPSRVWPLGATHAQGLLEAGAARVEIPIRYPVVLAGYSPPRQEGEEAQAPPTVRALVLRVGSLTVAMVSVDLVLVPSALVEKVRAELSDLPTESLWMWATHSHTSVGGFDARWVSQFAGTGRYREDVELTIVNAAVEAVRTARERLVPVQMRMGESTVPELVVNRRPGGDEADPRLTRVLFEGERGLVAEWVLLGAHPTLWSPAKKKVHADFPGLFSRARESSGAVVLFAQGTVGNSAPVVPLEALDKSETYARLLGDAVDSVDVQESEGDVGLSVAAAGTTLPPADSSRLVPAFLSGMANNLLCQSAGPSAAVYALRLGALELLSIPGEPTSAAARVLERESHASRVVALVNGYLGYVEAPEKVSAGLGESRRQYFAPSLLQRLSEAAAEAGRAAGFKSSP